YRCTSRGMIDSGPVPPAHGHPLVQKPGDPLVWYHPPDYRYGDGRTQGVLHFVQTDDGKLYYRSFNSRVGDFRFEKAGEIEVGGSYDIWGGMQWSFEVLEHYAHAVYRPHYVPVDARPGLQR